MQLHKILEKVSFVCGFIAFAAMGGLIQLGTGLLEIVILTFICILTGIWSGYESGYFNRRKR